MLYVQGFDIPDDEWDRPEPERPQTQEPVRETENLAPLMGSFVSGDSHINESLKTVPGFNEVVEAYDITYISGQNWLCFVRCILVELGEIEQTLLKVHEQLKTENGTGLLGVIERGAETGSELAEAILKAIFDVTGVSVRIALVRPKEGEAPSTARGSIRDGPREVLMLHTGAHFSLLRPKKT